MGRFSLLFGRLRAALNAIGPLPVGVAFIIWLLTTFRTLGAVDSDYGNFVTVAERLLAGDRLYVDVYENKDPLFHYLNAVTRWLSPLGSWLSAVLLLAASATAVGSTVKALGASLRLAFVMGAIVTPLVLTGSAYFPGTSHLPGVALLLVSVALAVCGKWVLGGLALGAVFWLKIVLIPVSLVALVVVLAYRKSPRGLLRVALGATVSIVAFGVVVTRRGESSAYIANLRQNTEYSSDAGGGLSGLSGLMGHLARVFDTANLTSLAVLLLMCALAVAFRSQEKSKSLRSQASVLLALSVSSLLAGLLVLALTGLWGHHALALAPSSLYALSAFAVVAPPVIRTAIPVSLPVFVLSAWLLAGMLWPGVYLNSLIFARANMAMHTTPGAEAAAILASGPATTYARVGNARDEGHALGLRDWKLVCPKFAEEVWESRVSLQEKLNCLPRANVIFVSSDVVVNSDFPTWTEFVRSVNALVRSEYECVAFESGRVCTKDGT